MPEQRRRVLIYPGDKDTAQVYESIHSILSKLLDEKKYEIQCLKHEDVISDADRSWAVGLDTLVVNNNGGEKNFDEKVQHAFVEYFLNSGKIVFLCNSSDGQKALWMLKAAAAGEKGVPFPDTVGLAYEKFALNQPIPANLQAFQVHKTTDKNESHLIDYAVGLVRGDSDLSYMYFVCEDGDTAVFVVSPSLAGSHEGPAFAVGRSQTKTEAFWRDILRVMRLIGVEVLPISPSQAAQRWADASALDDATPTPTSTPSEKLHKILIYFGPVEEDRSKQQVDELTATLKRLIGPGKAEIHPLKHEQLVHGGSNWKENCSVLFVDNREWERRFDDKVRNELTTYFSQSGKVVFFCDPLEGKKAMWLLQKASGPDEVWPEEVGKAYEHFARGQPVPTNFQAIQTHKGDNLTSLSLGLIKSANGAFTYLKCEDGDTAVFVAMTVEDVLTRGSFIWTELLRVVSLPQVQAPMSPSVWGPTPGTGLARMVKFINTGASTAAAAASSTASSIFGGLQDTLSKFLKGGDTSGTATHKKPPNLLIYVSGDDKAATKKFEVFSTTLREFLSSDRYTIYQLKKDQITGSARVPWSSNCQVLFVENDKLTDEGIRKAFADFFLQQSGKLVLFANPTEGRQALWLLKYASGGFGWPDVIGEAFERFIRTGDRIVPTEMEKFSLPGRDDECAVNMLGGYRGAPPILHFMGGQATQGTEHVGPEAVFVGSTFENVCMEKGEDVWKDILGPVGLTLEKGAHHKATGAVQAGVFFKDEDLASKAKASHSSSLIDLPSVNARIGEQPSKEPELILNVDEYFQQLKTKRLGHVVVYAPVVPSTMPISDDWHNLFGKDDYVVITKRQTQGQGRGGNQWLSPVGAALFSFCICVPQKTPLGKRLSFLQHLVTMAAADAIHNLNSALNVRIKWPNDIYYGNDTKIGGVLVKANFVKDQFVVFVGTGINVANHAPTVCLNDYLPTGSKALTPETVIAITLNRLEQLIDEFQTKGPKAVLPLYYKYWLHSDHEVTVASTGEKVKILGLDEYGFLQVKATESGREFTLHPDGNSFDMMANLIEGKETPKTK